MAEFLLLAFLVELTPGPNMAWLAMLGAVSGRRVALTAVAGVAIGLALAGLAAAFGLAAAIAAAPWAYQLLRYAGAAYFLWFAWDTWAEPDRSVSWSAGPENPIRRLSQGILTNLLNPKAYVFYIAFLPQFIDATRAELPQFLWLVALYVAVATAVHAAIAVAAGSVNSWLREPERSRVARRIFAVLFVGLAIWFIYATRSMP